jgi:hypothetical protein
MRDGEEVLIGSSDPPDVLIERASFHFDVLP